MAPTKDNMLPAPAVWKRYGKTDRTLARWLNDETLGFPRPTVIRGRRYFYEVEIIEWERRQATMSAAGGCQGETRD
ncbi:DNA-binding protein [Tardiphaga sp. 813_E8_N1_3]|uniref:DNA-binding protein n=1 Tax=Tardiphaga sp. 813_E8_N1_3 TaxID=3240760 RepID=UPI003F25836B